MSLYPSLEDMKVDQMQKVQNQFIQEHSQSLASPENLPYPLNIRPVSPSTKYGSLYPSLDEYMGLSIPQDAVATHAPQVVALHSSSNLQSSGTNSNLIAPLTGNSAGLARARVSHSVKEVILCKDETGKVGLKVQAINKGIFIALVYVGSPAALAGLKFGDQILMINDINLAGFTADKVNNLIKKASPERITMAIRDRPFERTITLHKDSAGYLGFLYKEGKITSIVQDSSAARNGLLIDHHLLEVNGQNVVGLKDKEISSILEEGGDIITLTIMPSFVFNHMMKHMASSLLKKFMDHSVYDI